MCSTFSSISGRQSKRSSPRVCNLVKLTRRLVIRSSFAISSAYGFSKKLDLKTTNKPLYLSECVEISLCRPVHHQLMAPRPNTCVYRSHQYGSLAVLLECLGRQKHSRRQSNGRWSTSFLKFKSFLFFRLTFCRSFCELGFLLSEISKVSKLLHRLQSSMSWKTPMSL